MPSTPQPQQPLLPWTLFSTALTDASNSLVSNANLIGKVYFPRLIVPAAATIVAVVDFLISLSILVLLMLWYRYVPPWQILLLPVFLAIAFCASLGPSLCLTALNVKYRDFRYVIPFIVQFGLYVSPVGFSSSVIPEQWRLLYSLNPLVGLIESFRACLLGTEVPWTYVLPGIVTTTLLFLGGVAYFRKMERVFADVV